MSKAELLHEVKKEQIPLRVAVAVGTLSEEEMKKVDALANSPEEWTELTGIKLGQQK